MTPTLHPWFHTPEAAEVARKAVQIPLLKLPQLVKALGADELESEALVILAECAVPPRNQAPTECVQCGGSLEGLRKGAKFCSDTCGGNFRKAVHRKRQGQPAPKGGKRNDVVTVDHAHVGSMHTWPEDEMARYAVRTVGMALCNWLRVNIKAREIPSSETLANMAVTTPQAEDSPRDILVDFLERKGLRVTGDESFEELAEATSLAMGGRMDECTIAILMAA